MIVDILSIFPDMFAVPLSTSIPGIAQQKGILNLRCHDLRSWTHDRHRTTDDTPYGGGQGQLMMCPPVYEALDDLQDPEYCDVPATTIFFTPTGEKFDQGLAVEFSMLPRVILVCGRYEGFDERVYARADRCISLGDFVISGGELAAMVVTDAICRLLPGVLGDEGSAVEESFSEGLLEFPQYTRPASYRDMDVPPMLLSGDHAKIAAWRRRASVEKTAKLRPDLLQNAHLTPDELEYATRIVSGGVDCSDTRNA